MAVAICRSLAAHSTPEQKCSDWRAPHAWKFPSNPSQAYAWTPWLQDVAVTNDLWTLQWKLPQISERVPPFLNNNSSASRYPALPLTSSTLYSLYTSCCLLKMLPASIGNMQGIPILFAGYMHCQLINQNYASPSSLDFCNINPAHFVCAMHLAELSVLGSQ